MDRREGGRRLLRIQALLGEGFALKAYGLARAAKADFLEAEEVDSRQLGWLRYYEFKALVELGAWQEAVELFRRPEPRPCSLPPEQAAWMHEAAAACAARLSRAEDVVRWAERAGELRRAAADPAGAAEGLQAACSWLERMGRPDLNTSLADRLIELGLEAGAQEAVIQGVLRLLDNYEARARATIRRRLLKGGALLPALRERDEAEKVLDRLKRTLSERAALG